MAEQKSAATAAPEFNMPDTEKLVQNLGTIAERSQRLVQSFMQRQAEGDQFTIPDRSVIAEAFLELTQRLMANPQRLVEAQMEFYQNALRLWQNTSARMMGQEVEPIFSPEPGDRRFKADEWAENAIFDYIKQSYLLMAQSLHKVVADVEGLDSKTAEKVEFYTRQFIDSIAPTNFAVSNPTVLRHTLETGGENLIEGLENLLADMERGRGELRIRMTDLDAFELGKNIATTPGKVVYQNELIQLIQYSPATEQVHQRPLMIVPPWINKFYILDLKPKNSFLKWAVDEGLTVFVMSWINPDESLADMDFEDYMQLGPLAAMDVIEQITGERTVNAIGYCLGGTLLTSTLAYLQATGNADRISSATLFTCMVDFSDPGELSVFIDEKQIALIEDHMSEKGYLEGSRMAHIFSMLRANDLIWSFVINNYLMGRDPMAFDLLYWNSDSTRMPARMHSFYLRNMYLENRLAQPGGISMKDVPIDVSKIKTPIYYLSAREDHIAPWKSTYKGSLLPSGPVRFVLGGSGHIAGVINPPVSNKYGYWLNSKKATTADQWLEGAKKHEGSWWTDWAKWVKPRSGDLVPAREPGCGVLEPIEDAPGSYVKERIS